MRFSWDEAKREAVLAKHGIDFVDILPMFAGRLLVIPSHRDEPRWLAIGMVDGLEYAVVFTRRGDELRLISARRAKRNERRHYHAHEP
ncbi:hypothetical protein C6W92_01840 [Roseovarius sp. A46]|jgi:hypothetical protein|uniref:BrnT family toxin n=1 Tax=Roseovarius sp. A46 TaxID=2109331 RepID=UPI001011371E|nr:BrnT family toxin [Roseovarius sp. A46]RXV66953.1 hypothetical protein C6W92_01840 [Roseovarius sp. A46]